MKLTITQKSPEGFLGGPKCSCFSVKVNDATYEIGIQQQGMRIITIETADGNYKDIIYTYDILETLLMLIDGQFYPVESASDGADITASWNERRLPSYTSADFMIGSASVLLDFEKVINEKVFYKWAELKDKLDLVHKMVLYCLSDVKMPKDMQSAYMIEAFKGLCDLIHNQDPTFADHLYNGKEPYLKNAFLAVIDRYGEDIFSQEIIQNKDRFAQILIESRNRIAHIKHRKGKQVLHGEENIWYIIKLSLLYRVALFSLLGISQEQYDKRLKGYVSELNKQSAINKFLSSLKGKGPVSVDKNLMSDIYNLLYDFVYSMAIYQSLHARSRGCYDLDNVQGHFWHAVSDNCLQLAVVDWCKVFGSNDERTHYSKIHASLIHSFEQAVTDEGIDLVAYSKSMKNFRDTFISHRDKMERRKPIPKLDTALIICDLYENKVLCGEPGWIPFELVNHYVQYQKKISQYLDSLGLKKI